MPITAKSVSPDRVPASIPEAPRARKKSKKYTATSVHPAYDSHVYSAIFTRKAMRAAPGANPCKMQVRSRHRDQCPRHGAEVRDKCFGHFLSRNLSRRRERKPEVNSTA
jgi:hypothetical protein